MILNLDARERLVILLISTFFALTFTLQDTKANTQKTIVVLGDSLVAGYGLGPGEDFPAQLQKALDAKGHDVKIVNAGVSGDTTTGGLSRLEWSLGENVDAVILELGANDALRGISPDITRKNLALMIERLEAKDIEIVLAGMLAPPNMGQAYAARFNPIYGELADEGGHLLYPFFLEGVAADPKLNQSDGIHPTAKGIQIIVQKFMPTAEELISRIK